MKCLKYLLCVVFMAAVVVTVPIGCGPGEATKIEVDDHTVQDEAGEEDYVSEDGAGGEGG